MVMKWQTMMMMMMLLLLLLMMMMISAKTGKNCVEPRNTISTATSQWIAMWQQVALKLLKNYAKHMGLQGERKQKMKTTKMKKRWCQASPRLTKLWKKSYPADCGAQDARSVIRVASMVLLLLRVVFAKRTHCALTYTN